MQEEAVTDFQSSDGVTTYLIDGWEKQLEIPLTLENCDAEKACQNCSPQLIHKFSDCRSKVYSVYMHADENECMSWVKQTDPSA